MAKGEHYSAQRVIAAIPGSGGIITTIAKRLGCNWYTVNRYIEKYPTVREAYEEEKATILDKAESNIIAAIHKGDLGVSRWYLSTIGRDRGYVERQEIAGVGNQPIVIDWDKGDDD